MARLNSYAEQHKSPQGPGDARPSAIQVVKDQNLDWTGKVILITGCSPGGLGAETAKALHWTGADVFITARDVAKGKQVTDEMLGDGKPGKAEVIEMDLGSLKSIAAGAKNFLGKSAGKLNVLVNNAGLMFCPEGKTEDGFETHLGTNHLGHFYLFHLLKDALTKSATPSFNSRIVSVSSGAHRYGKINLDDLNFERTEYDAQAAYGQSKLANIHFANELDRRYTSQGIRALSIHPGGIFTNITRFVPNLVDIDWNSDMGKTMKNAAQGAATQIWAAVAKELEGKGGIYLDEVAEAELVPADHAYFLGGYAPQAFDPATEKQLWEQSLKLTGINEA